LLDHFDNYEGIFNLIDSHSLSISLHLKNIGVLGFLESSKHYDFEQTFP